METARQEMANWHCLENQVVDSKFEVIEFLQQVRGHAFYRVRADGESEDLLLRAEDAGLSSDVVLDRFREAGFLSHPNLVHVVAAGRAECGGRNIIYLVTEMADLDLLEASQQGRFSMDDVADLVRQLAAGLAYLHSENFVYCALRAGSIWRLGEHWKLADFSEMRIAGRYSSLETRKLLVTPYLDCPPEANDGEVSKGWDVWSLASVLKKILLQRTKATEGKPGPVRTGASANIAIPAPYDRILRESMEPDLAVRADLDRVLALLSDSKRPAPPDPGRVTVAEAAPARRVVSVPELRENRVQSGAKKQAAISAGIAVALAGSLLFANHFFPGHSPSETPAVAPPKLVQPVPATVPETRPSPFGADAPASAPPIGGNAAAKQAISLVLSRWETATRTRDLEALVSCYAPLVDRFYGQRALSRERLRSQEQDVFARIADIRKFEISNIQFGRIGPQWAVVTFEKSWDFGNQSRFAGSERDEMIFRPVRGEWKIAGQQELKLHWVDKHGSVRAKAPG